MSFTVLQGDATWMGLEVELGVCKMSKGWGLAKGS